jgi:hypothetical protein
VKPLIKQFFQSPVSSSLLGRAILFSRFSLTCSVRSFPRATDQVSQFDIIIYVNNENVAALKRIMTKM